MNHALQISPSPGQVVTDFRRWAAFASVAMAAMLMSVLMACSTLGLPSAQTFNQKLAVAQGTVTQIRTTATQLLTAKAIGVTDAENVLTQTDAAASGIALARQMHATACPPTAPEPCSALAAENRLTMVTGVLTALQAYLVSQGK